MTERDRVGERGPTREHDARRDAASPGPDTLLRAAGNHAAAHGLGGDGPSPLAEAARTALESAYGVPLGDVRVRGGERAGRDAAANRGLAYARGSEIVLGPAAATPEVLAHELAHVVQQARTEAGAEQAPADLEAEARQAQRGAAADVTPGSAAHGAVQRFWPFDDDEEPERLPPVLEERIFSELTVDKTAWKRWIDSPLAARYIRGHGMLNRAYADDPEFQRWIKDPTYRPPGTPAPAAPVKQFSERPAAALERPEPQSGAPGEMVSGEGYTYESGAPVQGPVIVRPSEVLGLQANRPPAAERDWAKDWNAMTPEQRAKSSYSQRTTPRQRAEHARRGPLPTYIGKLEKELLEFESTLKMIPGARSGVAFAQAYWGEDIIGRKVDPWEKVKEGAWAFGEDLTLFLGPEDMIIGHGAKESAVVGRELEQSMARGLKAGEEIAPLENVLGRSGTETLTVTDEAAEALARKADIPFAPEEIPFDSPLPPPGTSAESQARAVALGEEVAPMETVITRSETPVGTSAEAQARAKSFKGSADVDPSRRPYGFETGKQSPGRDVAAGGLEDFESHRFSAERRRSGLQERFMRDALGTIQANPDHPLRFLLSDEGAWLSRTHLSELPTVQAGHLTSFHSGAREALALEDSFFNQLTNWTGETHGAIFEKTAIEIGGVPVEVRTARVWENAGLLPEGTVDSALRHAGWTGAP